jgi:hypothetical protein
MSKLVHPNPPPRLRAKPASFMRLWCSLRTSGKTRLLQLQGAHGRRQLAPEFRGGHIDRDATSWKGLQPWWLWWLNLGANCRNGQVLQPWGNQTPSLWGLECPPNEAKGHNWEINLKWFRFCWSGSIRIWFWRKTGHSRIAHGTTSKWQGRRSRRSQLIPSKAIYTPTRALQWQLLPFKLLFAPSGKKYDFMRFQSAIPYLFVMSWFESCLNFHPSCGH